MKIVTELAQEYGIRPIYLAQWKEHRLENIIKIFTKSAHRIKAERNEQELIDNLYRQIGKFQVELERVKKLQNNQLKL